MWFKNLALNRWQQTNVLRGQTCHKAHWTFSTFNLRIYITVQYRFIQKLSFNLFGAWMRFLVFSNTCNLMPTRFWNLQCFLLFKSLFKHFSVNIIFSQCLHFHTLMTTTTFHNHVSIFFQNDIRWLIEVQDRYSGKFCWSAAWLRNRIWIH